MQKTENAFNSIASMGLDWPSTFRWHHEWLATDGPRGGTRVAEESQQPLVTLVYRTRRRNGCGFVWLQGRILTSKCFYFVLIHINGYFSVRICIELCGSIMIFSHMQKWVWKSTINLSFETIDSNAWCKGIFFCNDIFYSGSPRHWKEWSVTTYLGRGCCSFPTALQNWKSILFRLFSASQ